MSLMVHSVIFNRDVFFADQTGISFFNENTRATAFLLAKKTERKGSLVNYHVGWTVDPQAGETILWRYDGSGSYKSSDCASMNKQALVLINCFNS